MFGTAGESIVRSFFSAAGLHPQGERLARFFMQGFRPPSDLFPLIDLIRPSDGRKVVIVDGHARSGKTWVTLAAFLSVIEQEGLESDEWWTAGVDSLTVCQGHDYDLSTAAVLLRTELANRKNLRLVLVDDFLGTNLLRKFTPTFGRPPLADCLDWSSADSWLGAVPSNCTLLLTDRSVFLTIVETLLDLDIRGLRSHLTPFSVKQESRTLRRHGLFRRRDTGEPTGAYTKDELYSVCESNEKYHPFVSRGRDWILGAAPVVAFGRHFSRSKDKLIASKSFFGDDLAELSRAVRSALSGKFKGLAPADELASRIHLLQELYLVSLAPALLFWSPQACQQFGIPIEKIEFIRESLYLSFASDDSTASLISGRLPNEFYMRAVHSHLLHRLPLLVRVFSSVVNHYQTADTRIIGLGLRGLVENALAAEAPGLVESLWDSSEFKAMVEALGTQGLDDALLNLETGRSLQDQDLNPGLMASIGWALYRFFWKQRDEHRREQVMVWTRRGIRSFLEKQSQTSEGSESNCFVASPSHVKQLFGFFSPLLQWAIRMEQEKGTVDFLDKLDSLFEALPLNAQEELGMILEDELIWAKVMYRPRISGKTSTASVTASSRYLAERLAFIKKVKPGKPGSRQARETTVNRVFSLAWHNEWMAFAPDARYTPNSINFKEEALRWLGIFSPNALAYLERQPNLLDDNLQYHWIHFITQHAVWMRDWCFEPDPDRFERRRVAPGSSNPRHNDLFMQIVNTTISTSGPTIRWERLRNLIFLVGTRASRLRRMDKFTALLDQIITTGREQVEVAALQAIFELARQGYFDRVTQNKGAQRWNLWSHRTFDALGHRFATSWDSYRQELIDVSHNFDLVPPPSNGWLEIKPWSWRSSK